MQPNCLRRITAAQQCSKSLLAFKVVFLNQEYATLESRQANVLAKVSSALSRAVDAKRHAIAAHRSWGLSNLPEDMLTPVELHTRINQPVVDDFLLFAGASTANKCETNTGTLPAYPRGTPSRQTVNSCKATKLPCFYGYLPQPVIHFRQCEGRVSPHAPDEIL